MTTIRTRRRSDKPPCNICGGLIRITNSRTYGDGQVRRRHKCKNCNAVYSTVEVRVETYHKMLTNMADFQRLKELLNAPPS